MKNGDKGRKPCLCGAGSTGSVAGTLFRLILIVIRRGLEVWLNGIQFYGHP